MERKRRSIGSKTLENLIRYIRRMVEEFITRSEQRFAERVITLDFSGFSRMSEKESIRARGAIGGKTKGARRRERKAL